MKKFLTILFALGSLCVNAATQCMQNKAKNIAKSAKNTSLFIAQNSKKNYHQGFSASSFNVGKTGFAAAAITAAGSLYHYFMGKDDDTQKYTANLDAEKSYLKAQESPHTQRNLAFVVSNRPISLASLHCCREDNANAITLESLLKSGCAPILTNRSLLTNLHGRHKFNFSQTDIYYSKGYFVLVPHAYIKQCNATDSHDLGLNLTEFKKFESPENILDLTIPVEYSDQEAELLWRPECENFVPVATSLLLNTHKEQNFCWNIASFGHGNGSESICGGDIDAFKNIMAHSNQQLKVNGWLYRTCYGGSAAVKQQFENIKTNFPIISVGYRDTTIASKSAYYFDMSSLFNALQETNTTTCGWKEVLAEKLNPLFTFKNKDSFELRSTKKDDHSSHHKNVNTKVTTDNLIAIREPNTASWIIPASPSCVDIISRNEKLGKGGKPSLAPVVIMDTDTQKTIQLGEKQLLLSSKGHAHTHTINTLVVPSINDLLNHFSYEKEHWRSRKEFIINKVIDQEGNTLENIHIVMPTVNDCGILKGTFEGDTFTVEFKPFNIAPLTKYQLYPILLNLKAVEDPLIKQ